MCHGRGLFLSKVSRALRWTNVSGYSQREYKFTALSATEFGRIYVSAVTVSSQMSSGVCALSLLVDEVLNNCRSNDEYMKLK